MKWFETCFVVFAGLAVSLSWADEPVVLKKLEVKPIKKIEMSHTLTTNVPTLNSVTLQPIQLNALELPQTATQGTAPTPSAEAKARPFPKWDDIKPDLSMRIFPVMFDGKSVYVSLYGEGFTISPGLENDLREIYKAKSSPDRFYIDQNLTKKVFSEMGISESKSLYWFQFNEATEKSIQIGKINRLLIKPNGAGDGVFGTVGIEVVDKAQGAQSFNAQGMAFIGSESQLLASGGKSPQWTPAKLDVPSEKVIEQAESISPKGENGMREVKKALEFRAASLGGVEFIEATAQFSRKYVADEQNGFTETLYGYFIREKSGLKTLYDYYVDATYFQKPDQILVGKWVKGFEASLYISSAGMGDCGRFVLVKPNGTPVVVPVRCGSWGC